MFLSVILCCTCLLESTQELFSGWNLYPGFTSIRELPIDCLCLHVKMYALVKECKYLQNPFKRPIYIFLSLIFLGIIVAGSPGTGKTTCLTILIDTVRESSTIKHRNTGSQLPAHKRQYMNPLAVSDPALMLGRLNSSGDFDDGIFPACWRNANNNHRLHKWTTCICLDAPLHAGWTENLNSALDKGEVSLICF